MRHVWGAFLILFSVSPALLAQGAANRSASNEACDRGDDLLDRGQVDAALKEYESANSLDKGNGRASLCRGRAHEARGEAKEALADYRAAEALFCLDLEKDPKDSLGWACRAVARARRADIETRLGESSVASTDCAITDAGQVRRLQPEDTRAWLLCGEAYLVLAGNDARRGQLANARTGVGFAAECFGQAIRRDPRCAKAWVGLGQARVGAGDRSAAEEAYRRCLEIAPDGPLADAARRALTVLGVAIAPAPKPGPEATPEEAAEALLLSGRLDDADRAIRALESDGRVGASLLRAQYCLRKGDKAGADKWLSEAKRSNPRVAEEAYDFACKLVDEKHWDRALLWCDTVEALDPNAAAVHFTRGQALAGLGQKPEAIQAYERYLELDTTSDWAAKARKAIEELKR